MNQPLELKDAQKEILGLVNPTAGEDVPLDKAPGRIAFDMIRAQRPVPAFHRAAMDGFAVTARDIRKASPHEPVLLEIVDEIAAGRTDIPTLAKGQAIQIMTGGAIPAGADLVIRQEKCRRKNNTLIVEQPRPAWRHIRKKGCEIRNNQIIIKSGTHIGMEHLHLLAEGGLHQIAVHRRPQLAFLCTGNELLATNANPQVGQIISGNRFLLAGLAEHAGSQSVDLGLAGDDIDEITVALKDRKEEFIITTGGMGPGKYDLMPEVFRKLGVNVVYESLNVRPGQHTMFGHLGGTLFFGLPGPPPAVRLLFQVLVRPALLASQGIRNPFPPPMRASLTEPITLRKSGRQNLRGGVFQYQQDQILVKPAKKGELITCIISIPKNRKTLYIGEKVTVIPIGFTACP